MLTRFGSLLHDQMATAPGRLLGAGIPMGLAYLLGRHFFGVLFWVIFSLEDPHQLKLHPESQIAAGEVVLGIAAAWIIGGWLLFGNIVATVGQYFGVFGGLRTTNFLLVLIAVPGVRTVIGLTSLVLFPFVLAAVPLFVAYLLVMALVGLVGVRASLGRWLRSQSSVIDFSTGLPLRPLTAPH